MRFEQRSSHQDFTEYEIIGYSAARTILVYAGKPHVLDFLRSEYRSNKDPTAFDRLVLSRQGGAIIKIFGAKWGQSNWPRSVYGEFVAGLEELYLNKRKHWDEICKRRGWDADMFEKEDPIPKPMYFDGIRNRYRVERWFLEEDVKATAEAEDGV